MKRLILRTASTQHNRAKSSQTASKRASSIDPNEVSLYDRVSTGWWNKGGPVSLLHPMATFWIEMIETYFVSAELVQKDLINSTTPLKNKMMLDVGCGGGLLSEQLTKKGANVVGLEVNSHMVKVAKEHASLNKCLTNLTYLLESVEEHALGNSEKYDAVIASYVIQHVTDHELFLESCVKCVKPGGSLFLSSPSKNRAGWWLTVVFCQYITGMIPRGIHDWNKFITPEDAQGILKKYNCRIEKVSGVWVNLFNKKIFDSGNFTPFFVLHAIREK